MRTLLLFGIMSISFGAQANPGLVKLKSQNSFEQTVAKAETFIKSKGLTLFAKIDHAKNAKNSGLKLQPNTVLIFGNPKVGSPLMNASATFGIDLPVKFLVYQQDNQTYVAYNKPGQLAKRHGVKSPPPQLAKMSKVLEGLSKTATKK